MGDYDMRIVVKRLKIRSAIGANELKRPHILMPQKSKKFSTHNPNASVSYENERAASRENVSANPFADHHCRPWTPASLFLVRQKWNYLTQRLWGTHFRPEVSTETGAKR